MPTLGTLAWLDDVVSNLALGPKARPLTALPIALLGTPHYLAAWSHETWKPVASREGPVHLLVIVRFDAACCCSGMPLPSLPQRSFQMREKKTTVMSNRLAQSPKNEPNFFGTLTLGCCCLLLTRTPVSPGPARQSQGKPTNCRGKGLTAHLPLHRWPPRPFLCHGKTSRN